MHGSLRDEEVFVTEFRNLPEGWLAVLGLGLALAVLWAVVWMYRREGRIGASTRRRMILAILRCAVFVTLGVVFLEPVRVRILRRWIDSYTIVLVDKSSSMDLVDTYRDAGSAEPEANSSRTGVAGRRRTGQPAADRIPAEKGGPGGRPGGERTHCL